MAVAALLLQSKIFLVFRSFRLLRMLNKSPYLTKTLSFINTAYHNIHEITLSLGLFVVAFSIIGVNIYKGKLYYCTDQGPSIDNQADCSGLYQDKYGYTMGRKWLNSDTHFDNFFNAVFTLFLCATSRGWVGVFKRCL